MGMLKTLLNGAMAAAVALSAGAAVAQETFPTRQLHVIMPGSPGGSFDIMVRMVMDQLGQRVGQPVVVENVTGAAGMLAMERGARAEPDGHHLVVGYVGSLAANPWLFPNLKYDPIKDFQPIVLLGSLSCIAAVPANSPIKSFEDLLQTARDKPGTLNFASAGQGTCGHISAELLKSAANIDMVHIPYQTAAPASVALLGGQVDFAFEALPTALPNIRAGKLRALAITSPKRSELLPEIPTVAESGFPGYAVSGWVGVMAPAGVPPHSVEWLNREINEILATSDIKARYLDRGADVLGGSPEDFAALIKSETEAYGRIIETTKANTQ